MSVLCIYSVSVSSESHRSVFLNTQHTRHVLPFTSIILDIIKHEQNYCKVTISEEKTQMKQRISLHFKKIFTFTLDLSSRFL